MVRAGAAHRGGAPGSPSAGAPAERRAALGGRVPPPGAFAAVVGVRAARGRGGGGAGGARPPRPGHVDGALTRAGGVPAALPVAAAAERRLGDVRAGGERDG